MKRMLFKKKLNPTVTVASTDEEDEFPPTHRKKNKNRVKYGFPMPTSLHKRIWRSGSRGCGHLCDLLHDCWWRHKALLCFQAVVAKCFKMLAARQTACAHRTPAFCKRASNISQAVLTLIKQSNAAFAARGAVPVTGVLWSGSKGL